MTAGKAAKHKEIKDMALLNEKQIKEITGVYPFHSQDDKGGDAVAVFRFVFGAYEWYAIEGEHDNGNIRFYGMANLGDTELGYFSLNELERIGASLDERFTPTCLKDLKGEHLQECLRNAGII